MTIISHCSRGKKSSRNKPKRHFPCQLSVCQFRFHSPPTIRSHPTGFRKQLKHYQIHTASSVGAKNPISCSLISLSLGVFWKYFHWKFFPKNLRFLFQFTQKYYKHLVQLLPQSQLDLLSADQNVAGEKELCFPNAAIFGIASEVDQTRRSRIIFIGTPFTNSVMAPKLLKILQGWLPQARGTYHW